TRRYAGFAIARPVDGADSGAPSSLRGSPQFRTALDSADRFRSGAGPVPHVTSDTARASATQAPLLVRRRPGGSGGGRLLLVVGICEHTPALQAPDLELRSGSFRESVLEY